MTDCGRIVLSLAIALTASFICRADNIDLIECPPPDYPHWGGYGPRQDYYTPGDSIHYYCDVDNYIGGNYFRMCLDSGDWTGDTPVCDGPMPFSTVVQSSTANPESEAEDASDGIRTSCSSTKSEPESTWTATFEQPCHVIRVMLFLPRGDVAYEVLSVKSDGREFSCGRNQKRIERYEWTFHNCLEPNNKDIIAIKIRSLANAPLQLCEVVAHALTDPTCVDPHVPIQSGRLILSRKTADLVCDKGFRKSRDSKLDCIRTGVWTRKSLYCVETDREVENIFPRRQTNVETEH